MRRRHLPPRRGRDSSRILLGAVAAALLVPALGLITTALIAPARATAADVPIAFADEHVLKLRWSRLQSGTPVEVCNTQAAAAAGTTTPVTGDKIGVRVAEVRGFSFEVNGEPVADSTVINVKPTSLSLAPDKCDQLSLTAGHKSPDSGEYTGVLLLRVALKDGTAFVRRDVTIVAPKVNATRPTSAVDEVNLRATRNFLSDDSIGFGGEQTLPLDARPRPRLRVPPPGALIGVLQNGTHRASIYVAGALKSENGRRLLPVRIDGPGEVGTYSGSVDLATGEDAALPVKLKVDASDAWYWALAAIAVGLLLAGIGLWLRDHTVPKSQLQGRRKKLLKRYRDKRAQFANDFRRHTFSKYELDEDTIKGYQERVRRSIERYADDHLLFDRAGDDFKKLVRTLQEAEDDADLIADGLGAALLRLEEMVVQFRAEHPDSVPTFVERAAARLAGGKLPVGGATELSKEVDSYLKLAEQWHELARTIKRLEGWIAALEQAGIDKPAREQLERTRLRLREARLELLHVTDAAELEAIGTARELSRAYDELAPIGARYNVWEPPADETDKRATDVRTDRFRQGAPDELGELVAQAQAPELVGWTAELLDKVGRGFAELAVVALAIATSLLVALPTVFSDDTFGSWRDYLAALALGGAAVAAAKGIIDLVAQMIERARV